MSTKVELTRAEDVLAEHLQNPAFRMEWEQTALARAVAIAVAGYRAKHHLTQTQLGQQLGVRQPRVARLELGEYTPSLAMLQRLAQMLGLRFIIVVAAADAVTLEGIPSLLPDAPVLADVTSGGSRVLVATG